VLSIKKIFFDGWQGWTRFWFGPVSLLNLAVFRIIFCGTMFVIYLSRQADVGLYFTDQGLVPKAMSSKILLEFFRPPIQLTFWSDAFVPWMHALLVLSLLLLCLGIGGRLTALIAAFLQISFLQRNYAIAFGADQIGTIFTLYLAFTNSCARLSLLHLWKKAREVPRLDLLTPVFYRLLQIQLCVIYAFSGFEKLKGLSWWDGTALWTVFANSQMVVTDMTWTRHFPLIIATITFSTIAFEVYFTPLVWNQKTRKYVLGAGVLFHLGIAVIMALYSFAVVMISPYFLFLSEQTTQKYLSRAADRFGLRRLVSE
jgi:hypothetical protein